MSLKVGSLYMFVIKYTYYTYIIWAFNKTKLISTASVDCPQPILNLSLCPSPIERGFFSSSYYVCKQSLHIKCDAVSIVFSVIKLS